MAPGPGIPRGVQWRGGSRSRAGSPERGRRPRVTVEATRGPRAGRGPVWVKNPGRVSDGHRGRGYTQEPPGSSGPRGASIVAGDTGTGNATGARSAAIVRGPPPVSPLGDGRGESPPPGGWGGANHVRERSDPPPVFDSGDPSRPPTKVGGADESGQAGA